MPAERERDGALVEREGEGEEAAEEDAEEDAEHEAAPARPFCSTRFTSGIFGAAALFSCRVLFLSHQCSCSVLFPSRPDPSRSPNFQASIVPSPILDHINFVDTPGILAADRHGARG